MERCWHCDEGYEDDPCTCFDAPKPPEPKATGGVRVWRQSGGVILTLPGHEDIGLYNTEARELLKQLKKVLGET